MTTTETEEREKVEAIYRVSKLAAAAKSKAEWHEEEGRGSAADYQRREQRLWLYVLAALSNQGDDHDPA